MDVSFIVDQLNDEQRQAVTAEPGPMLVLAGAGSGKTRVLVHRIAWMIRVHGLNPQSILSVTFTNKAAQEMRTRIEQLIGISTQSLWVGTFHGLSHRFLRQHYREAGLPQAFTVMDSDDQLRLIKRIMKDANIDDTRWPPKQVQQYINQKKDEGLRAAHIDPGFDPYNKTMHSLYLTYEETCQRSGLVDFAELLLRSFELWRHQPELLAHYQARFKTILVDEFQDTNAIQYAWLKMLAGDKNPIMVVGDDDQSIYGWRGARIENIHRFVRDFPGCTTIRLEQNYRSTGTILKAANQLIANNSERMGKSLWTEQGSGPLIDLYVAFNETDEAHYIVSRMKQWRQAGGRYQDCAVLYRSNAQSRVIEDALIQGQIPYRVYGGLRYFERAEIKDALAYLRMVANPEDDTAFERVVNFPARGIGERTVQDLRDRARENQMSLWQVAIQMIQEKALAARALAALQGFIDIIVTMRDDINGLELSEQVACVIDSSGLIHHYQTNKADKSQSKVENLEELVTAAQQFVMQEEDKETIPLHAFLSHAALESGEQQAAEYADSVQLMTLHTAKGLEFGLVFLAGLEEGLFPHQMSIAEGNRLQEERRLCYVGMTRAMKQLVISYAESRMLHGRQSMNGPSRFIEEMPSDCIRPIRQPKVSFTAPRLSASTPVRSDHPYRLGMRVRHAKFGEGVVIGMEGQGAHARVHVNFDKAGAKWLVIAYAKLET